MKVYIVTCDWLFMDNSDLEITAFNTFQKAFDFFNKTIEENKQSHPWLSDIFDEYITPPENEYSLYSNIPTDSNKETECCWRITDKKFDGNYFLIDLRILEIQ